MTNSHVPRWFTEGIAVQRNGRVAGVGKTAWGRMKSPPSRTIGFCRRRVGSGFVHPVTSHRCGSAISKRADLRLHHAEMGLDRVLAMLLDFAAAPRTGYRDPQTRLKMEPPISSRQFSRGIGKPTRKGNETSRKM